MKKIILYCVTYNSYDEAELFLQSVNNAAAQTPDMSVTVVVADNTEDNRRDISTEYDTITVQVHICPRNLGYLGAVQECMRLYAPNDYDFFAISNVDLKVDAGAFAYLSKLEVDQQVGWIAPQIYSVQENRDRNPKILSRYSRKKLSILHFLYKHPWANRLYEKTLYKRKKVSVVKHKEGEEIYAGHGSFMIFTHAYLAKAGLPNYPVFLFGEEIYFAEQCRLNALKTVYVPGIRIVDSEHCSTSSMHSSAYYRYNAESLQYILQAYY